MVTELDKNPHFFALISVGIIGGLLAGFFGVGGGVVMVPLLLWWAQMNQREVQATSLLAIAPAALVGTVSYAIGGVFPLLPALLVSAGGVVGAQLGAFLLRRLSLTWLRWSFIIFVAGMAVAVMLTIPHRDVHIELSALAAIALLGIGLLMGTSAGLFGIGGGIIAIPLLMLGFGAGDLEAKGVSLIAMAPAALSGSFSHLRHKTARLRNGLWVAAGALIATPIGSLGAFLITERYANVIFGAFGLVIATILTIRAAKMGRSGN